jgi:hypothetical protein
VSDKPDDERGFKLWDAMRAQAAGSWAESRRLAAAMRMVIERLIKIDAPEEELRRAAEGLERYAGRLEAHPQRMRPAGFAEAANAGDIGAFFDYSPLPTRVLPAACTAASWRPPSTRCWATCSR